MTAGQIRYATGKLMQEFYCRNISGAGWVDSDVQVGFAVPAATAMQANLLCKLACIAISRC